MYPYIIKNDFNHASETNMYEIYNSNFSKETDSNKIHLTETKNGYHLEMEIAGYVKDDFNFYINNNDLVLTTAKRKDVNPTDKSDIHTTKHSYCYASALFKKIFHLPNDIVKNEITVDYTNHILSIDLFKSKI